jgi:nucleoside-diphosphate-sugar epimerase
MTGVWAGKRVVVTGGAGFLGACVVEALRGRGVDPFIPRSRDYDLRKDADIQRMLEAARPGLIISEPAGFRPCSYRGTTRKACNGMMSEV